MPLGVAYPVQLRADRQLSRPVRWYNTAFGRQPRPALATRVHMPTDPATRDLIARSLGWSDAHVAFEEAVRDLPPELRGVRPPGLPHSAWELVEHIRIAQRDILDFAVAEEYHAPDWPTGYWPATPQPPSARAWEESLAKVGEDRGALERLARDAALDLSAVCRHGETQTYLRELLLVLDHAAYHVGQLVLVRTLLGAWPPPVRTPPSPP